MFEHVKLDGDNALDQLHDLLNTKYKNPKVVQISAIIEYEAERVCVYCVVSRFVMVLVLVSNNDYH